MRIFKKFQKMNLKKDEIPDFLKGEDIEEKSNHKKVKIGEDSILNQNKNIKDFINEQNNLFSEIKNRKKEININNKDLNHLIENKNNNNRYFIEKNNNKGSEENAFDDIII